MLSITNELFDQIISQVMDELPEEYISRLDNVVITYEDRPTQEQREKLKLRGSHELLGLYEGVPLTKRGSGYNFVLPDKITLFKEALMNQSHDLASFKSQVKHTLWHEIAHYYGLDHDRIHAIEANWH